MKILAFGVYIGRLHWKFHQTNNTPQARPETCTFLLGGKLHMPHFQDRLLKLKLARAIFTLEEYRYAQRKAPRALGKTSARQDEANLALVKLVKAGTIDRDAIAREIDGVWEENVDTIFDGILADFTFHFFTRERMLEVLVSK